MQKSSSVLGKGLSSLLPNANTMQHTNAAAPSTAPIAPPSATSGAGAVAAGPSSAIVGGSMYDGISKDRIPGICMVGIDEIAVNQYQPRRDFDDHALLELAQSIESNGIIQPLVVRRGTKSGYELIAGERRLRASKLVGLKQVPVVVRKSTDREALEIALIENIQRQNLNCIDEALAYHQLQEEFKLTQEEVAKRVGKDRATVSNFVRLLRLPEAIIDDLKQQILTFGHGKALLGLEDLDMKLRARATIVEKRLSVRDTENLVEELKKQFAQENEKNKSAQTTEAILAASSKQGRLDVIAQDLTRQWSAKVELKGSEKRGKILFHYSSRQELERLLHTMQNQGVWGKQ